MAIFNITNNSGENLNPPSISFSVSTLTDDSCILPDLSPYNIVWYHTGEGEYPVIGDTVYTDIGLTTYASTTISQDHQMSNLEYISITGVLGVVVIISCK